MKILDQILGALRLRRAIVSFKDLEDGDWFIFAGGWNRWNPHTVCEKVDDQTFRYACDELERDGRPIVHGAKGVRGDGPLQVVRIYKPKTPYH